MRIADDRVSRTHAIVELRGRSLFVRDLESRHGSFVDGARVGCDGARAAPGSVIRFGNTLFLAVDDVDPYRAHPRRIPGAHLDLPRDVVAGPVLGEVWDQAARVAGLREPVLILGETGTGKECVARMIHASAGRDGAGRDGAARAGGGGAFVGLNVAAIPEGLFEAELFGHTRGAFTGAVAARTGAFAEAADGVLFLDEVGDLRSELQVKLLRALDLGRVRPLGAGRDVRVSARVVSATSRDLERACEEGLFRPDLWYRLSGLVLEVPPLRARRDDILLLAAELLRSHQPAPRLTAEAAEALLLAPWPGNARQLQQVLARAVDQARHDQSIEIHLTHLPELKIGDMASHHRLTAQGIQAALKRSAGVASRAADLLGVSRSTFYNSLKRLGIDRDGPRSNAGADPGRRD